MAATPNRQFQFIGGPTFEQLFARYTNTGSIAFTDFPGNLPYAELRFYSKFQGRNKGHALASTCAWLNGVGIYYGSLVFGSQDKGQDVLQNGKLLAYPATPDPSAGGAMRVQAPLSLTLTEFHFLLVLKNRLLAINQLSEEIVYEEVFNTSLFGDMAGLATDARKDAIWLYSDKFVFAVDVVKEDRDAWKLYLRDNKFEEALDYCDTDAQEERVLNAKADYLFEQASFEEAAQIYAKTKRSFEEVALKFVNVAKGAPVPNATSIRAGGAGSDDASSAPSGPQMSALSVAGRVSTTLQSEARAALKTYLLAKLNALEATELTQQVMVCTWLTEIFLDNINRLQEGVIESAQEQLRRRNASTTAAGRGGKGSSRAAVSGDKGTVSTTSPFPDLSEQDDDLLDDDEDSIGDGMDGSDEAALLADERAEKREQEVSEFRAFLHDYFDCLNKEVTFELIASHGRASELLYFAEVINDLDWVLTFHVQQQGNYFQALEVLSKVDPAKTYSLSLGAELFYKFAPALMRVLPRKTVDLLIRQGKALDPGKLIPALMRDDEQAAAAAAGGAASARAIAARRRGGDEDDDDDEKKSLSDDDGVDDLDGDGAAQHSIRYLEHMILRMKNRDGVLHNYLVSLYARQKDDAPLLHYLRLQQAKRAERADRALWYDYKYALRVCHEHGHLRACVLIYETMQLYEEATRLALAIDLELAKGVVQRAQEDGLSPIDEQQRKRLWILIARHVIAHESDISKAMSILKSCDGVQLEQILPFFPDFVRIGDFKDEIARSLSSYNGKIEQLKADMEEFTESAQRIRQDIGSLRARHGVVSSHAKCDLCSQPVLTRHFFLFPCTHAFHTQCCVAECAKHLNAHPALRAKLMREEEEREQASAHQQASMAAAPGAGAGGKAAAAAAADPLPLSKEGREARCLENYAASECVLCGEIMIDSVAKPFILMPDEESEVRAWEV